MTVDERSEVRFSIPEVTLLWQPIFCQFCGQKRPPMCGLDKFALRPRYRPPRLGTLGWAEKNSIRTPTLAMIVATGSSMPTRGYAIGIMTLVTSSV